MRGLLSWGRGGGENIEKKRQTWTVARGKREPEPKKLCIQWKRENTHQLIIEVTDKKNV